MSLLFTNYQIDSSVSFGSNHYKADRNVNTAL